MKTKSKSGKFILIILMLLLAMVLASKNAEAQSIGRCLSDIPSVFIEKFKENIDETFAPIKNLFSEGEEETKSFFGKIIDWIKEKFSSLDFIKETGGKIKEWAAKVFGPAFAYVYATTSWVVRLPGVAMWLIGIMNVILIAHLFRKFGGGSAVLLVLWLIIFAAYSIYGKNNPDFVPALTFMFVTFPLFFLICMGLGIIIEAIRGKPREGQQGDSFKAVKEVWKAIWGILKNLPWGDIIKALFSITLFIAGLAAFISGLQTAGETLTCLGDAITNFVDSQQSKITAYFDNLFEKVLFKPIDAILGAAERKVNEALARFGLGGGTPARPQQSQPPQQPQPSQSGQSASMREISEQAICGQTFSKLSSCADKANAMRQITLIDQIRGGCGQDDYNKLMNRRNEITSSFGACP